MQATAILLSIGAAAAALQQINDEDPAPIKGPYTMSNVTLTNPAMDSSDRSIDVFYPAEEGSFPLIAYAHGLDNGPSDYTPQFEGLVSFGYIVVCPRACHTGCHDDKASLRGDPSGFAHFYKQQLLAIEWAKKQASSNSTIFRKADFTNGVAIAGHSMGGQSTVFSASFRNASANGIAAAVMHHAYTHEYPAPTIPFLAFTALFCITWFVWFTY